MRWHIDTGVAPIFMSKNLTRVTDYLNIFDFALTENEVALISNLNENFKLLIESWGCPGF